MKTLLKHADMLSMESGRYAHKTDILIENEKIAAIGNIPVAADYHVIDCSTKIAMPSLFDAHVHMVREEMMLQCIACGITSVRHLSGGMRQKEYDSDIRAGKRVGPYIYSSGPIIDSINAPKIMPSHIYIKNADEAEHAVRDTVKDGYRWVKNYPSLSPDELKRLMDTANELGIKVCGHMSYHVDAKTLTDWGYACCEHSSSLPKTDDMIDYMADRGMWFCPTQVVCETLPDYVWNNKKFEDLPDYRYVPKNTKALWEKENKEIIDGYRKIGLKPDIQTIINRGSRFMKRSHHYMAGSDAIYPGIICGFALHDELYKLVSLYGLSPIDALRAATLYPAQYMELSDCKGELAPDMDADILILDADPLADIRNTRKIYAVMQGGKLYDRARLDAMLAELEDPDREFEVLSSLF